MEETDTINGLTAADSLPAAPAMPDRAPWTLEVHEQDAPWSAELYATTPAATADSYLRGVDARLRPELLGGNSWLVSIMLFLLVLLAMNFNNCRHLFKNLPQDLVGIRRSRGNAFDERTSNEARSYAILVLLLCLCEAVILADFFHRPQAGLLVDRQPLLATMQYLLLAGGFYLFQLGVYNLIGYVFSDSEGSRQWIRGFNSSQSLLALLLLLPTLLLLVYPQALGAVFVYAVIVYFATRALFICKGFRIFYKNFPSLLYFILYLCSLETIPLLIFWGIATLIAK